MEETWGTGTSIQTVLPRSHLKEMAGHLSLSPCSFPLTFQWTRTFTWCYSGIGMLRCGRWGYAPAVAWHLVSGVGDVI